MALLDTLCLHQYTTPVHGVDSSTISPCCLTPVDFFVLTTVDRSSGVVIDFTYRERRNDHRGTARKAFSGPAVRVS